MSPRSTTVCFSLEELCREYLIYLQSQPCWKWPKRWYHNPSCLRLAGPKPRSCSQHLHHATIAHMLWKTIDYQHDKSAAEQRTATTSTVFARVYDSDSTSRAPTGCYSSPGNRSSHRFPKQLDVCNQSGSRDIAVKDALRCKRLSIDHVGCRKAVEFAALHQMLELQCGH